MYEKASGGLPTIYFHQQCVKGESIVCGVLVKYNMHVLFVIALQQSQ